MAAKSKEPFSQGAMTPGVRVGVGTDVGVAWSPPQPPSAAFTAPISSAMLTVPSPLASAYSH